MIKINSKFFKEAREYFKAINISKTNCIYNLFMSPGGFYERGEFAKFDDNWKQVIYKRKEKLHNPIKQNYGHIQALKEILNDFQDINYISIVAFTTKAELKVTSKTDVVYTINLPKTIKKYNSEKITDLDKEEVYTKLVSLNVDSKEARKSHVKAIHKTLSEKSTSVKSGTCPKCGGLLVLKNGKYGQFKGCNNFPKCRFIAKR